MNFRKYQSVKRPQKLLYKDYESRLEGHLVVFPKLDGANASVWINDDGTLGSGSRNKNLDGEGGLQGFREWCLSNEVALQSVIRDLTQYVNKPIIIYGEWLVPHAIKNYTESAWRNFHIFDVMYIDEMEHEVYVSYAEYAPFCTANGLTTIPPIAEFPEGTTEDQLLELMNGNTYLVTEGIGEGIVVKDYNLAGRSWIKYVHPNFSGIKASKTRKVWDGASTEEIVVAEFLTKEFVTKEYNKILTLEPDLQKGKLVPQLLGRTFHSFVEDFTMEILKKHKNATINYGNLRKVINMNVKELLPEVF